MKRKKGNIEKKSKEGWRERYRRIREEKNDKLREKLRKKFEAKGINVGEDDPIKVRNELLRSKMNADRKKRTDLLSEANALFSAIIKGFIVMIIGLFLLGVALVILQL